MILLHSYWYLMDLSILLMDLSSSIMKYALVLKFWWLEKPKKTFPVSEQSSWFSLVRTMNSENFSWANVSMHWNDFDDGTALKNG